MKCTGCGRTRVDKQRQAWALLSEDVEVVEVEDVEVMFTRMEAVV